MVKHDKRAPMVDAGTFDLLVAVPARLSRLHGAILGGLDPRLTFRQYRTLSRVAQGYTSMSQLAARGNLSLPTVSENVDGLVRRGLMTTTQSEQDRRAVVLAITDAGRSAVAAADAALREFLEYVVEGVSPADFAATVRTLDSIYTRATIFFNDKQIDRNS